MERIDLSNINHQELIDKIDNLQYQNYKWNRQQFPRWTVDQLAQHVYGHNAYLYELMYQEESKNEMP